MRWTAQSALLALSALAEAAPQGGGINSMTMLRFGCAQVVIDRIDPCVNTRDNDQQRAELTT